MSDLMNKENGLGMLCKTCGQEMSICEYREDTDTLHLVFSCEPCSELMYVSIDKNTGDGEYIVVGPLETLSNRAKKDRPDIL